MASSNTADDVFEPSVWGDFFATYSPPLSQRSEEWMRERAEQLKGEVRQMLADIETESVDRKVVLVDTLEHLGIDNHLRKEIEVVLSCVHQEVLESGVSTDLRIAALQFRLLRQHGFWVSPDVFDKFKDSTGSFKASLCDDPMGLLSLYNAAHLAIPGEEKLDEAISFSEQHLSKAVKAKLLESPLAEQVSRCLDIPLPRTPKRLETMQYIGEYKDEDMCNSTLLELARLDIHLVRSLHLKELKALTLWWRDLYDTVKLSYARDRLVENYFWILCVFHEEEHTRARITLAKHFGLLSLMDDTYDLHATIEQSRKLNEAIQRWDENAISILPDYLGTFYIKMLTIFEEIEESLEPNEKYRTSYGKKAFKLQSVYYLEEAEWSNDTTKEPTFKEHMEVSIMSSGYPVIATMMLLGAGEMASKEAFDWASTTPDIVYWSGAAARFLNDIASYKVGKRKKDMVSSVECYQRENGTTGEEALAAIATMSENAWRRMNQACMEVDRTLLPVAELIVNLTRALEVIYLGGRDGYTFGENLKEAISSLLIEPVPV